MFNEADVVDFGAARGKRDIENNMKRRFDDKQDRRRTEEQKNSEMFGQIDHAVAATIDFLVNEKGMDQMTATDAVMKRLSDLVMAHDI